MNEDIQRTVASAVTSSEIPKTIAQIVSDEGPKVGNSSEMMDALYEDYQIDKKIPWARYIFIYLVVISVIAGCVHFAPSYFPRKLHNPYMEAQVIDKMGYFTDAESIKAELEKLQEKTGAYFTVAAIPHEEYETPREDGSYLIHSVYGNYCDDEDHIFIYITHNGKSYHVHAESGANAKTILSNTPVAETIQKMLFAERELTAGFVAGLREIYPNIMKINPKFWFYFFGAIALTVFLILHCYNNVIKRCRFEKAEKKTVED